MTAKTRRLLMAFAGLGLGASAWSSYVHHALLTRPGYASFCDINSTVSCTQAYLSQYGSIWGIPVAIAGVFFFTVVFLLVGLGGRMTVAGRENVPAYVFALSTVGLGFVLYLAWASFFQLQAVCMLCVATYVAVIGLFVVSGGASSAPMTTLPRRAVRDAGALMKSPVALAIAVVFSAGAVALLTAFPRETHGTSLPPPVEYRPLTDQQRFELIQWFDVQPRVDLPIDPQGARVVVAKFNDYQCPACRDAYVAHRGLEAKYEPTGDVKFVTKHFPLEPECNPAVQAIIHNAACEAAAAVLMAEARGTADKLEEWLFANLPTLSVARVRQAAADVGGIPDFDAQYATTLAAVRADAELGAKVEVTSTPTFFVNGVKIPVVLPPAALEALIQHELQRTS
jgi:uncharacterized membrane protein